MIDNEQHEYEMNDSELEAALAAASNQGYLTVFRILQSFAEQGSAKAQTKLGMAYQYGNGLITKNQSEAVKWYRKAAEQGYAPAQVNLGRMYEYGWGVELDYSEAMRWFLSAAEQGNKEGRGNIGRMHHFGEGVPKDIQEAIRWWRIDADRGDGGSQETIGRLYLYGHGVEKNLVQAYFWYILSMRNSTDVGLIAMAKIELKKTIKEMTTEQLAEGKRLVAAWQPITS